MVVKQIINQPFFPIEMDVSELHHISTVAEHSQVKT